MPAYAVRADMGLGSRFVTKPPSFVQIGKSIGLDIWMFTYLGQPNEYGWSSVPLLRIWTYSSIRDGLV